jgi:hypothetical protein
MLCANNAAADALQLKPPATGNFLLGGLKALTVGAVLLAAVGGGLWYWRRKVAPVFGATSADAGTPQLQSSKRISQKTVLLVVQWQGHSYLLAETNGAVQLLDKTPVESES